jgi:hypothetical protein
MIYFTNVEARLRLHYCIEPSATNDEAMKLGSIASDVGEEHTLDVLYPPGEKDEEIVGERLTEKAERFLQRKFKKLGPKKFANMPLPPKFWRSDF